MSRTAIVIPNLNGADSIDACLKSLMEQATKIIVVENGSTDNSLELIKAGHPKVDLIVNKINRGFAGGVNQGIKRAIEEDFAYVALFNNDAVADKGWLDGLETYMDQHPEVGIATCKFLSSDGKHIDSTGDLYTDWGLPYPRGRKEKTGERYDKDTFVFAASGGASIYRVSMLKEIGLFDEDFFAYYEDVDLSFRAQLAGWKVAYVPGSVAYHQIGATSGKIKGFTTYQAMKNLPLLFYKNVPAKYFKVVGSRLSLAMFLFLLRAISRGQGRFAFKGLFKGLFLIPKKRKERHHIQGNKKVGEEYIWNIITHDLPPNAAALRKLRSLYWKLIGAKNV